MTCPVVRSIHFAVTLIDGVLALAIVLFAVCTLWSRYGYERRGFYYYGLAIVLLCCFLSVAAGILIGMT